MSGVILASFSTLDMDALLPIARQALGRSITSAADYSGTNPPLHHMLCVASIKDQNTRPTASSVAPYLDMFHAGFFIASHEEDFVEILEIAALPSVVADTVTRGVKVAYITGTVAQWRQAMLRGCTVSTSPEVRNVFNSIYKAFCKLGLSPALGLQQGTEMKDKTFLLEYKKP
jgi:hypothetical protein